MPTRRTRGLRLRLLIASGISSASVHNPGYRSPGVWVSGRTLAMKCEKCPSQSKSIAVLESDNHFKCPAGHRKPAKDVKLDCSHGGCGRRAQLTPERFFVCKKGHVTSIP
jgi:hypothetical protein